MTIIIRLRLITDCQNGNNSSLFSGLQDSQIAIKPGSFTGHQQQRHTSHSQQTSSRLQQSGFSGDLADSPGTVQTPDHLPLSQMSELDRFGLAGILAMVRNDNQDLASLAVGQDLTQLGLDLNSSESVSRTSSLMSVESTDAIVVVRCTPPSLHHSPSQARDQCSLSSLCRNATPSTTSTSLIPKYPAFPTKRCFTCFTPCLGMSCKKSLLGSCEHFGCSSVNLF